MQATAQRTVDGWETTQGGTWMRKLVKNFENTWSPRSFSDNSATTVGGGEELWGNT